MTQRHALYVRLYSYFNAFTIIRYQISALIGTLTWSSFLRHIAFYNIQ